MKLLKNNMGHIAQIIYGCLAVGFFSYLTITAESPKRILITLFIGFIGFYLISIIWKFIDKKIKNRKIKLFFIELPFFFFICLMLLSGEVRKSTTNYFVEKITNTKSPASPVLTIRNKNYETCLNSLKDGAEGTLIIDEESVFKKNIKGIIVEEFKTHEDYCKNSKYIKYKG